MDFTKEYYKDYFDIEEKEKEDYNTQKNKYIMALYNDIKECWGSNSISKLSNIKELIEEKKKVEKEEFRMIADDTYEKIAAIYKGTHLAYSSGFTMSSDNISATLSQSPQWVTRELSEHLDYIELIKPNIYFSMNFKFNVVDQQILSKKKYLYNEYSFIKYLQENLKEVDKYVELKFNRKLNKEEQYKVLEVIKDIKHNSSSESNVENIESIMDKKNELMSISALKQYLLKEQVELNATRMRKKLYKGLEFKMVNNKAKKYQEHLIETYIKNELRNLKNSTTIYNQQIYRYLDNIEYTKYHLYTSKDKAPTVLYSIDSDIKKEESIFSIKKAAYYKGIEIDILKKAGIS